MVAQSAVRSGVYCGGMTAHAVTRHEIFQTSLISALAQGVYEDEMTLAELLGHGSTPPVPGIFP